MSKNTSETLQEMRAKAEARRQRRLGAAPSLADRAADWITNLVGSWRFILVQSALLATWIAWNAVSAERIDPYPFILLNLLLSFQAAYTAPVIMMSQNRQAEIDRDRAIQDFEINCKAELEIEALHHKLDQLRDQVARVTQLIEARN